MNNQASQTLLQIKLWLQNITMVLPNTTNTSVKIYSYTDGEFTGWVSCSSPQLLVPPPRGSSETHPGSPSKRDAVSLYLWTWILQPIWKVNFKHTRSEQIITSSFPNVFVVDSSSDQLSRSPASAVPGRHRRSTRSLAQRQLTPEQWPAPATRSQPQQLRTALCSNTKAPRCTATNTHTHHTLSRPPV